MTFDFDEIIPRANSNSSNYEGWRPYLLGAQRNYRFAIPDDAFIRLWIADMDFATPAVITDAIRQRLDQRLLGYSHIYDPDYYPVLARWFQSHYRWSIDTSQIVLAPGVVPAITRLIGLLTQAGENLLIATPSYRPFVFAGQHHGRTVYTSAMKNQEGRYTMDLADIEKQLADRDKNIRVFILCNPHNPTRRVWTREELQQIGECCLRYDCWIISDEIHGDLLRNGQQHIPLATLFPASDRVITCTAPSKTFNLAGNLLAHIFVPNAGIRQRYEQLFFEFHSPLSIAANKAAYEKGEEWLLALRKYLDDSFDFLRDTLQELLPLAKYRRPEATYLAWIDISAYADKIPDGERYAFFFAREGGVLLEGPDVFVDNGNGHIRINIACPRQVLAEGLRRIAYALR